jgi:hypothetical protein
VSQTVTFKVGDRVTHASKGGAGVVIAAHRDRVAVWWDEREPSWPLASDLTLIPPAPVAVSWRNVYPQRCGFDYDSRKGADQWAGDLNGRLGLIVGYSDGTYKLEVIDQ